MVCLFRISPKKEKKATLKNTSTPNFCTCVNFVFKATTCTVSAPPPGGTPLYLCYRYVPPPRVGFLHRFGPKTSIDFASQSSGFGYGFRGNKGVHDERIGRKERAAERV